MAQPEFNYHLSDSQGTLVSPVSPSAFDLTRYQEHEAALLEGNRAFWNARSGVQVYRRFRVPSVFATDAREMERSLALQLGALQASLSYKADIANFLEPWYGIGTIASAYGVSYVWEAGQAPATRAPFASIKEAAEFEPVPVAETEIGKQTLSMIEYFLDQTRGKIPMALTDTQSPMNVASYLVETNNFYMGMFDEPDALRDLLSTIARLTIDFSRVQQELIGDALVCPGHGFASSRMFQGIGMSDDTMIMLSPRQYKRFEAPALSMVGDAFNGAVFHSCGNWARKIPAVRAIQNLIMVDGAFSSETDPSPNPPEDFAEAFANTGIVVNARIVGNGDVVTRIARTLWKPGMKLILVTYCQSPEEQQHVYNQIHNICSEHEMV